MNDTANPHITAVMVLVLHTPGDQAFPARQNYEVNYGYNAHSAGCR